MIQKTLKKSDNKNVISSNRDYKKLSMLVQTLSLLLKVLMILPTNIWLTKESSVLEELTNMILEKSLKLAEVLNLT